MSCDYAAINIIAVNGVLSVGAAIQCRQATGFACPEFAGYNVQWQQI